MKKRMFLTTVLMALVLLLAVTTATFAWYSANAGSITNTPDTSDVLKTESTEISLEGVTFTAEYTTDVDAENPIVLTNEAGQTGYMVGSTPFVIAIPSTQKGYAALVVKVTASLTKGAEATGTLQDALAALYANGTKSVTLTITPSSNLRVSKEDPAKAAGVPNVYSTTAGSPITFTLDLNAQGTNSVWNDNTFYYSAVGLQTAQEETDFASSTIVASIS